MKELIDSAWDILNIQFTFNGVSFAIWHMLSFTLLISFVLKIITGGLGGNKDD